MPFSGLSLYLFTLFDFILFQYGRNLTLTDSFDIKFFCYPHTLKLEIKSLKMKTFKINRRYALIDVTCAATVSTPPCWMACRSNMAGEVFERVPSLPSYLAGLNLDDKKSYE